MPLFGKNPADTPSSWEPPAADTRLAHTAGAHPGARWLRLHLGPVGLERRSSSEVQYRRRA
jgi:hypothetical protein